MYRVIIIATLTLNYAIEKSRCLNTKIMLFICCKNFYLFQKTIYDKNQSLIVKYKSFELLVFTLLKIFLWSLKLRAKIL